MFWIIVINLNQWIKADRIFYPILNDEILREPMGGVI